MPRRGVATAHPMRKGVLCAGLFSSGSTWVFNVARQLLRLDTGSSRIVSIYADAISDAQEADIAEADVLVIKSHQPSATLRALSRLAGMRMLVTVRDPRDAVVSLMTRFEMPLGAALPTIMESSRAIAALRARTDALVLRYEDGFTESRETVDAIAAYLGLTITGAQGDAIHNALTPASVRETIASFAARGIFDGRPPFTAFEPETHWHLNHVGDRQVGKWRQALNDADAARILYATREFRAAFGYDGPPPLTDAADLRFCHEGTGVGYITGGFSVPEPWGIWTETDTATIDLAFAEPIVGPVQLRVTCRLGPTLRSDRPGGSVRLLVNDQMVLELGASADNPTDMLFAAFVEADPAGSLRHIQLRFESGGMMPVSEFGQSDDRRRVGIGVVRIQVDRVPMTT